MQNRFIIFSALAGVAAIYFFFFSLNISHQTQHAHQTKTTWTPSKCIAVYESLLKKSNFDEDDHSICNDEDDEGDRNTPLYAVKAAHILMCISNQLLAQVVLCLLLNYI